MTSADESKVTLTMLQAQAALTVVTSTRIWADVDEPPAGYKPADGVGICFKVRGGIDLDPPVLMSPSMQFKIYGANEVTARSAARVLHDAINERSDANILTVYRETLPVTLKEPDTNWTYCLVFYKVMVRNLT